MLVAAYFQHSTRRHCWPLIVSQHMSARAAERPPHASIITACLPTFALPVALCQINSALVVRRNVFSAILHALLTARIDVPAAVRTPRNLVRILDAFFRSAGSLARSQQRRAMLMTPLARVSSTLLAVCEIEFLGWAALTTIAHYRPASLGRRQFVRVSQRRLAATEERCQRLATGALPLLHLACRGNGLPSTD